MGGLQPERLFRKQLAVSSSLTVGSTSVPLTCEYTSSTIGPCNLSKTP